jgi:Tetracyclin repressor-like, C-terminal domain
LADVQGASPVSAARKSAGARSAGQASATSWSHSERSAAYARRASLLDLGVAYVRFAIERRPYFDVMFRPDLYRRGDPELVAALKLVDDTVFGAVRTMLGPVPEDRVQVAATAAWALVHGLATLIVGGNLPPDLAADPEALTRAVGSAFFADARQSWT